MRTTVSCKPTHTIKQCPQKSSINSMKINSNPRRSKPESESKSAALPTDMSHVPLYCPWSNRSTTEKPSALLKRCYCTREWNVFLRLLAIQKTNCSKHGVLYRYSQHHPASVNHTGFRFHFLCYHNIGKHPSKLNFLFNSTQRLLLLSYIVWLARTVPVKLISYINPKHTMIS